MTPSLPTLSIASAMRLADGRVAGRDARGGSDLLPLGLDLLALFSSDSVTASTACSMPRFQTQRVGAGRNVAQTLAHERLGQHGGGGGAVAGDVVSLLGDFLDELGTDLLVGVLSSISLAMETPSLVIRGAPLLPGRRCGWGPTSP